ncbi:MAG: RNA 2',3'-cyclic phosphodiesterase [Actinobacteria bacterium]|nr:MAG: RNA 2',3'-cyclic phosphodiesterase [Actinomycetota bacterium]
MARDRAARPEAKPLRLFVAVDIPEAAKRRVAEVVSAFKERIPAARWTRPEGWHVTLKFLGSTWPRLFEEVRHAVAQSAASGAPFQTSLTGVGVFPSPGRARVVWVGLADPEGRFAPMVKVLDRQLAEHFVPEKRAFTPHLTVARLNPPQDIRDAAPDLVGTPVGSEPFRVDRLVLYRSHLSPAGARYEPISEAPLAQPAAGEG